MNTNIEGQPRPVEIQEFKSMVGYRLFVKDRTAPEVFAAIRDAGIERLNTSTVSQYSFSDGHFIVKVYSGDYRTQSATALGKKKDSVVYVSVPHIKNVNPSDAELYILTISIRKAIEKA
jgi:hypothetical protein